MPVPEENVLAAGSAGRGDDLVHAETLATPAVAHARSEAESLTVLERCVALRLIFGQGPNGAFDVAGCVCVCVLKPMFELLE